MALFGEKYGEIVRMVEVGDGDSRASCAVARTWLDGRGGRLPRRARDLERRQRAAHRGAHRAGRDTLLRHHDALLRTPRRLRTRPEDAPDAVESALEHAHELERELASGGAGRVDELARELTAQAVEEDGLKVVTAVVDLGDPKQLLDLSDRVKSSLHDAAVVLGTVREGRPHLIASLTKSAVEKGLNAADIIRAAAEPVGGQGGGRDTMAQAGGKDAAKLDEALAVARRVIEEALHSPG